MLSAASSDAIYLPPAALALLGFSFLVPVCVGLWLAIAMLRQKPHQRKRTAAVAMVVLLLSLAIVSLLAQAL